MTNVFRVLAVVCCTVGLTQAQIGSDADACKNVWGSPVSGRLDASGNGTLHYSQRGTDVALEFAEGIAWIAEYNKEEINEKDIDSLLRLNGHGNEWLPWTAPGIPESKQQGSMWMRSDEDGMAFLKEGNFRVKGTRGMVLEREARSAATKKKVSDPEEKVVVPNPENIKVAETPAPKTMTPAPKPTAPGKMPSLGDLKEDALSLLGEPSGTMESGGKEILVYGWGSVWIDKGLVCEITK